MSKDEIALRWIVDLLRTANIPFQVVGGLAARVYGATRPLHDLDFYVPNARLVDIAMLASQYVEQEPVHVQEAGWDIEFMKLNYEGQRVELGGDKGVRIFNPHTGQWVEKYVDLTTSVNQEVLGVLIPVMPLNQLAAYKRILDREVDRQDLLEIGVDEREA